MPLAFALLWAFLIGSLVGSGRNIARQDEPAKQAACQEARR